MSDLSSTKEYADLDAMPCFNFAFEQEAPLQALLAQHRAWLKSTKRERPLPKHPFRVAVYIRYFNQTKHEDYLAFHKQQFLDTIALCPNWTFADFYIDEGQTAPNMETAPAWAQLLADCYDGKVDLILTQKASNVSKKQMELVFCARLLASLKQPVGIYFISEDIYTLASYYLQDLKDPFFLPGSDWQLPEEDAPDIRGLLND